MLIISIPRKCGYVQYATRAGRVSRQYRTSNGFALVRCRNMLVLEPLLMLQVKEWPQLNVRNAIFKEYMEHCYFEGVPRALELQFRKSLVFNVVKGLYEP